jgi:hypothetical protein
MAWRILRRHSRDTPRYVSNRRRPIVFAYQVGLVIPRAAG